MKYYSLAECVADLEKSKQLVKVDHCVDPYLEIAAIQRRAYRNNGPAILFTNVKNCTFPMLANLFGSLERVRYIFRSNLKNVEKLLELKADPAAFIKKPFSYIKTLPTFYHAIPKTVKKAGFLGNLIQLSKLPQLVSWPEDGGAYITLPLVSSNHPNKLGILNSNLGMYRVQISGNDYIKNKEVGMHYQLHRGIGVHHAEALANSSNLPVAISVGGHPALTIAAVMPLPENVTEFSFANALAGYRIPLLVKDGMPPVAANSDFCIYGHIANTCKPEGPFGDHLGYYSLKHNFPLVKIDHVYHKKDAIYPFTSVGRPPQEDTVLGAFIHELVKAMVPSVFYGVHEVHAVDAAGVHPLLLAIGSDRYTPYEDAKQPRELLTQGLHLFGTTQTSLTKYLIMLDKNDNTSLSTKDFDAFFKQLLERTSLERDVHILPRMTLDTLDYTGSNLNEGSKMLWVASGNIKRELGKEVPNISLPGSFLDLKIFRPGILVCKGPKHTLPRDTPDTLLEELGKRLSSQHESLNKFPLLLIVDDTEDTCKNWDNFLFNMCTRSDPSTDTYGVGAFYKAKHWGCSCTLIIDARAKLFHPKALEEDLQMQKHIDSLSVASGPLFGIC